jgi:hypothetical protein
MGQSDRNPNRDGEAMKQEPVRERPTLWADEGVRIYDLSPLPDRGLTQRHQMVCVDLHNREGNVFKREVGDDGQAVVPMDEAEQLRWLNIYLLEKSIATHRALLQVLSLQALKAKRQRETQQKARRRALAKAAKKTAKKTAKRGRR